MEQLEISRARYTKMERLEHEAAVALGRSTGSGPAGRIAHEHDVLAALTDVADVTAEIRRVEAEELMILKVCGASLTDYYDRVNALATMHASRAAAPPAPEPVPERRPVVFSGAEAGGKCLDLHLFHMEAGGFRQRQSYLEYLNRFPNLDLPEGAKTDQRYVHHLAGIEAYLRSFLDRTQPLASLAPAPAAAGGGGGGGGGGADGAGAGAAAVPDSLDAVAALGMAALKEVLQQCGLKCGGTLEQRAARYWAHLSSGPAAAGGGGGDAEQQQQQQHRAPKSAAALEAAIAAVCQQLDSVLVATRRHVERAQNQLVEEKDLEAEQNAGHAGDAAARAIAEYDSDDESSPLYNPLNLPLGWDGKPIPFWLYKLHGLGTEFKCEICGNFSYWGRRAFDRHFQEWRHAHGMRCLKVPNTKAMHDITLIQDALNLNKKMSAESTVERLKGAAEFEDSEGNVLSRELFEDLSRQGLI